MGWKRAEAAAPAWPVSARHLDEAVLRTLAYADVYDCPLRPAEAHRFLVGLRARPEAVRATLERMAGGPIGGRGGFFFLSGRDGLVEIRQRREQAAAELWPRAREYGERMAGLPFVRMVAVTGSLARDNVEPGQDVDYLVITEPGRLWACRALVGLLARRAVREGVTLCANYFLAEDALVLEERDLYTAHEVAQMVPLSGARAFRRFRWANPWVGELLPNAQDPGGWPELPDPDAEGARAGTRARPRTRAWPGTRAGRVAESMLRTPPGGWLDRWERARKLRVSIREGRDLSEARFEPGCFKGHFHRHAARARAAYAERLASLGIGGL